MELFVEGWPGAALPGLISMAARMTRDEQSLGMEFAVLCLLRFMVGLVTRLQLLTSIIDDLMNEPKKHDENGTPILTWAAHLREEQETPRRIAVILACCYVA